MAMNTQNTLEIIVEREVTASANLTKGEQQKSTVTAEH
jgi:hypothetical protein